MTANDKLVVDAGCGESPLHPILDKKGKSVIHDSGLRPDIQTYSALPGGSC
jgi:hypothetical protein